MKEKIWGNSPPRDGKEQKRAMDSLSALGIGGCFREMGGETGENGSGDSKYTSRPRAEPAFSAGSTGAFPLRKRGQIANSKPGWEKNKHGGWNFYDPPSF